MASTGNGHERQEADYVEGDAVATIARQGHKEWLVVSRGNRQARGTGQWMAMETTHTCDVEDMI